MRLIDADVAQHWMERNKAYIDVEILRAIPTVDAEPVVHGWWVNAGDWELAKCSVCGECYDVSDEATEEHFKLFRELYRYCPHCGAKMEKEDENDGD